MAVFMLMCSMPNTSRDPMNAASDFKQLTRAVTVAHVVRGGTKDEVSRVHASRVVAAVTNNVRVSPNASAGRRRERPVDQFECDPMGRLAAVPSVTAVALATGPLPALTNRQPRVDVKPEVVCVDRAAWATHGYAALRFFAEAA